MQENAFSRLSQQASRDPGFCLLYHLFYDAFVNHLRFPVPAATSKQLSKILETASFSASLKPCKGYIDERIFI